jgi:hypothetical protein
MHPGAELNFRAKQTCGNFEANIVHNRKCKMLTEAKKYEDHFFAYYWHCHQYVVIWLGALERAYIQPIT